MAANTQTGLTTRTAMCQGPFGGLVCNIGVRCTALGGRGLGDSLTAMRECGQKVDAAQPAPQPAVTQLHTAPGAVLLPSEPLEARRPQLGTDGHSMYSMYPG